MLYKIAQENLYKEAGLIQAFKNGVGKLKDTGVKMLGGVTKKDVMKQKLDLQGKMNQKEMMNNTLKNDLNQKEIKNNALKSELNDANLQVDTLSKRLDKATQEANKHKEQVDTLSKKLDNATQEVNKHKDQVKTVAGLGALGTAGGIVGTYALTRPKKNQNNV